MLKRLAAAFILIIISSAATAEPLPYRIWQLHCREMSHMKRMVDLADKARINRIQLSHNIVMDVEEPLEQPKLVEEINEICDYAHAKGIAVDMWTHELNGLPDRLVKDRKADLDNPEIWSFLRGKYEKLFTLCPELDGLVLTMHETAMSIYSDSKVESSTPPERRVAQLIDNMSDVCKKHGKMLFVRTFSYEPWELEYIRKGLEETKSDVIVMSKAVPHDWQPYYPHNPAIGNVGGKKQVIEFDLGYEFQGLSTIPCMDLPWLEERLDYALSEGNVVGAVLRVERLNWRAVDTPNQANIDVFSKLLLVPTADSEKLYKQWLVDRYGEEAMPYLFSAFSRTFDIVNKSFFVLGFWITDHSMLPSHYYAIDHLHWVTTAKWDPSYKELEQELFKPTLDTMRKISEEKEEALRMARASVEDIKRAKPYLSPDDYDYLLNYFQRTEAMVKLWKAATEAIFGIEMVRQNATPERLAYLSAAADRLEKVTEENKQHYINMAADHWHKTRSKNVDRARELVQLARKTVKDRK